MNEKRMVIGLHSTREALRIRPNSIASLLLRDRWKDSEELRELADLAQEHKVAIKQVPVSFLDKFGRSHQGVGAEVTSSPELNLSNLKDANKSLMVALDQVEDPQNLGAVLRTAWLLSADGVVIPKDRTSPLSPTVAKIASGAMEHVPVEVVSNLPSWLKDRKEDGYWIYGFAASGKNTIWQVNFPPKTILVLGAEGHGLRKPTVSACDEILRIPQSDVDASFNVSVAAAIAMAEVSRQLNPATK